MSMSVCVRVCVCVCLSASVICDITVPRGSALFWRRCDAVCTSGFMYGVVFGLHIMSVNRRHEKSAYLK